MRTATSVPECTFKVSIVGCGNVGATIAYALLLDGLTTDLTLIDVARERAEGIMLDLEHSLPFTNYTKLEFDDDMRACRGSQIVIITAGRKQQPGQTRLDLAAVNKKIMEEIVQKIAKSAPHAVLLIVSNPLDVMTYAALKASGFPWHRVFGSGTALDTARLRYHISQRLKIHPRSIDAYILGEHGDSSFPVWSSANIMGKALFAFPEFSKKTASECAIETKQAAYRIINDVGFTCYSIATVTRELVRTIHGDTREVFPLSVLLDNFYGHRDVCLSVPCVLGRRGIEKVLDIPLNVEEQKFLEKSSATVRGFL